MKKTLTTMLMVVTIGMFFFAGTTVVVAESKIPSIAQESEPIFLGIGFSLMGKDFVATDIRIEKVAIVNLKTGAGSDQKKFRAILVFGSDKFPLNILEPDLSKFEADIMQVGKGGAKGLQLPIGHVSFSLKKPDKNHTVAIGKLLIKSEDIPNSGDYKLMLNELPLKPGAPGGAAPGAGAKDGGATKTGGTD